METYRLLSVIVVVMSPLASTVLAVPLEPDERQCLDLDEELRRLVIGEQFYFVPYEMGQNVSKDEVRWYRDDALTEPISTDQNQRVHYQGGALFFMDLRPEDSGKYTAIETTLGDCYRHHVEINVLKEANNTLLLYEEIKDSSLSIQIPCPDPARNICLTMNGTMSWMKDFKPLPGQSKVDLRVSNATKASEGVYTCVCTWKYNQRQCTSSASRRLVVLERNIQSEPFIVSPSSERVFVVGDSVQLNCTVFCGEKPVKCKANWKIDRRPLSPGQGYRQTHEIYTEKDSRNSFATAVLFIDRVSARDLRSEFTCFGEDAYETKNRTVTLQQRVSIVHLSIGMVCVWLLFAATLALVKCLAVDLVLLFRPCLSVISHSQDARAYDAYVVYRTQHLDRPTEDALCQFITSSLPSVLEDKCGYRLFIQGRDDTPGEDHMELVEGCMKQSKRLMVILTPTSEPEVAEKSPALAQTEALTEFDWQVGLHHVLVQREMSIILIQIGEMGPDDYKHLPAGMQHLIKMSAPIRWQEGSRCLAARNSRFWKKVRYLMPAVPATKCKQASKVPVDCEGVGLHGAPRHKNAEQL